MASTINTSKLAPRIVINENDISNEPSQEKKQPVTLIFGFSPIGKTNEMVVCNSSNDILSEFGSPTSAPEKYFIDAALRVVGNNATALMTRLPYDNFQCHNVKYVDYKIADPIAIKDIATGPAETKMRETDDIGVTILKEMNELDSNLNQFQRIEQVVDDTGFIRIGSMTNDEFNELELDPTSNLDSNTFRIIDIVGQQYGVGESGKQYTGIFPIIVTAPMALYYQTKIQNTTSMDDCFTLIDLEEGIEMSTKWYKSSNKIGASYKTEQAKIVASIKQDVNFDTSTNRFHRMNSFQDECCKTFPSVPYLAKNTLERTSMDNIGVLVCRIGYDDDQQTTTLTILESFVGKLGYGKASVDRKINASSKYIRMYKNLSIDNLTDYFVCDHQKLTSIGMQKTECAKYINYKTSIIDPVTHMLESVYSDVDSLMLDVILDAGLSATAFAAYVAKDSNGDTYITNNEVRTLIDWASNEYAPEDYIEDYATVWNTLTRLFGDFIKSARGDCVYIADGPRIANLERNYPIANYTDLENIEMFNNWLPYFQGYTNNYVARYWNWVFIEDMQWQNRGIWVPPSVVMGSQLAYNDASGHPWFATAGQNRGIVSGAFNVSVRTKEYNNENDTLYQNQWNFFKIYQNTGVIVEGNKDLQTKQTSMDRLNVRRMVCYIKQQLRIIGNHYKYEPNTKSMRESFVSDVRQLLNSIMRDDGISDYQILCDDTNNTTTTIDRHELWCKIGIKPIKALEYIIIDLNILNGTIGMNDSKVVQVND